MISLNMPTDNAIDTFELCISKVRNIGLKARLTSISADIENYADVYDDAATNARLHTLVAHKHVGVVITKKEMGAVYTGRMAKKGQPGRVVYDRIMMIPDNEICPLCSQRTVGTLDHHLPKSSFPSLAVVPANLIAACEDCNKAKLDKVSPKASRQSLHPYYDQVPDGEWLHAELTRTTPAKVKYSIPPPVGCDRVMGQRLDYHFSILKLAKLYRSHAGVELVNQRVMLRGRLNRGGRGAVRAHLQEVLESYEAVNLNSWQSALYRALVNDDWYCDGGFDLT